MTDPRGSRKARAAMTPKLRYSPSSHCMTRCQSDDDGDCTWKGCPQLRDKEPKKSGRHCPLDMEAEDDRSAR